MAAVNWNYQPQEVFQIRVEGYLVTDTVPIKRWMNCWHMCRDAESAMDPEDEGLIYALTFAIAMRIHEWYADTLLPHLSSSLNLAFVRAQMIVPNAGPFSDFAASAFGTGSAEIDEPDDALVMQKRTQRAGRSAQGRVYIPGVPDDSVSGGYVTEAYCQAIVDDMETGIYEGFTLGDDDDLIRFIVWSQTIYDDSPNLQESAALLSALTMDRVMRRMTSREVPFRLVVGASPA
jgi:hypothetical protein